MGLKDSFLNLFRVSDDAEYVEYDEYEATYQDEVEQEYEQPVYTQPTPRREVAKYEGKTMKTKINIVEPRVYSEVEAIAALLIEKQAVLLNLKRVDEMQARRIIDYMAGIAYATNGDVQKLSADIFLCVPANIEIEGMLSDEVDPNHLDFFDAL